MKTLRPQTTTRTWTPLVLRPLQVEINYISSNSSILSISHTPWNGAPPLIFIEGSHSFHGREFSSFLLEPTSSSNEELPHRNLKVVGPMGWSADHPAGPSDLPFLPLGCSLGPPFNGFCLGFCHVGFLLWWAIWSMWSSCDGVWSNGVLLLIWKGYDCPSFSAKTCTHRNLEGHMEFGDLLVAWV